MVLMQITRRWAFIRRTQYGSFFALVVLVIGYTIYRSFFYAAPTCYDHHQNGGELGVDCGGPCARLCLFQVTPPTVQWARSFKVVNGQYNAVGYVQNTNLHAGTPALPYTFSFYDAQGLITKRRGVAEVPPNSVYPIFEPRILTNSRTPTQTFLTLGTTTDWMKATITPQQFTVQSRTLTGADSSPRLTAQIYNNALTDAKNVQVVATIFDQGGNALTSSRTYVDDFPPRSTKSVVFTWPEPIAKTIRSCEVPTDVALAIDLSGSMDNDGGNPPQPISSVLKAADTFTTALHQGDQAAVVTFASRAALVDPLSGNLAKVANDIEKLRIAPSEQHGTTNTGDAIKAATTELTSKDHNSAARKVLVLLTDGLATSPDPNPSQYALQQAAAAKAAGITIYTIGLGKSADMQFLEQVASSPADAYAAVDTAQVDGIYTNIKKSICQDGPAVIEIIPKSTAGFATINPSA